MSSDQVRKHGDTAPRVTAPPVAQATQTEASHLLTQGMTYTGKVTRYIGNGTYSVELRNPKGAALHRVGLALPWFGGLIGVHMRVRIPEGTWVRLVYDANDSFIFAAGYQSVMDDAKAGVDTVVWGPLVNPESTDCADIPGDIVEGEVDLSNVFGVGVSFLATMTRMRAGDRAVVEACMINNMVRLICDQYRAVTGIGEEEIFDHGRPTLERTWSSYRHEIHGALKEGDPLVAISGDSADKEQLTAERVLKIGRYRLLEYIGFAGDLLHSFISDPPAALVDLAQEGSGRRPGKSWIHRNSDGSLVIQSVADIVIERVTRIPVPYRKTSHEDPQVAKNRNYNTLASEFLKLWDFGKEGTTAYRTAYQLRSYSRWLTRFHAFARILQLPDEYDLKEETDAAYTPTWTNSEDDKVKAAGEPYMDAYACVSILRDGSIMIHDGYGSTVALSNGSVQVSAAKHLDLQAAGDVRLVAGGSLFVKAHKHIEMSAITGGLTFYGYSVVKAACEAGMLWLRSDAGKTNKGPREDGAPEPEFSEHAVYIEAPGGRSMLRTGSKQFYLIEDAKEGGDGNENSEGDFVFKGTGNFRIIAEMSLLVTATKDMILAAAGDVVQKGVNLVHQFSVSQLSTGAILRGGVLHVARLLSEQVTANRSLAGPQRGPMPMPNSGPTTMPIPPTPPHINHVDLQDKPEKLDKKIDGMEDKIAAKGLAEAGNLSGDMAAGPKWQFLPAADYDAGGPDEGSHVQTLTQQYIHALDGDAAERYKTWTWSSDTVGMTVRVGQHKGPFGTAVKHGVFPQASSVDSLHEPSSKPLSQHTPTQGWTTQGVVFKFLA